MSPGIYKPTMLIRRASGDPEADSPLWFMMLESLAFLSLFTFVFVFVFIVVCYDACIEGRRKRREKVQGELGRSTISPIRGPTRPPISYDTAASTCQLPGAQPYIIRSSPNELIIWIHDGKSLGAPLEVHMLIGVQPEVIRWTPNGTTIWTHDGMGQVNEGGEDRKRDEEAA